MVTWTHEADARLFLAILAEHPVKVDYKKVAERFGNGATPRAIVERLQKLRAKAAVTGAADDSNGNGEKKVSVSSAPNTPRKRRNQRVVEGGVAKVQGRRRVKREETETEEEE
ncbi:hypothetical protein EX30DRAFT_398863 [Ascodesmis nigricans]|uniref:Myb-like domain-containing protein n=1 Tax=Ascodesmis nigricans TaxID=341454 RepID=A0A4S2MJH9_9PEZI|nr:hypothetical protein EX30DRAFT_398863 [Ascodesmis nigricans]